LKILLTNDDGIEASGLSALYRSVRKHFGDSVEVIVVAPDRGRSECGHSVTGTRPLNFAEVKEGWISVDGTPVDCVRAAFASLAPDAQMVISGVNAGANLGVDLLVSGTFAAAREAAFHGIPAMAVSHYRRSDVPSTWDHVPQWLAETLSEFTAAADSAADQEHAILWNVNLPAIDPSQSTPPKIRCPVDSRPLIRSARLDGAMMHLEYDFHSRPREVGCDVEHCFSGLITISELIPRPA
jgi:5'-nucleotidase